MLLHILPSKVPFFRNEAKTEISSCIILSYPTQTIACFVFLFIFIFKNKFGDLSGSSSQVFLVQNYFSIFYFFELAYPILMV